MKLSTEWPNPLHRPPKPGKDWCLTLPFAETLRNAFELMCPVDTIGMRITSGRCWTYLNGTPIDEAPLENVRGWLETIGRYVALRDCLALSFALDYDRQGGDPNQPQSEVGGLRGRAKPYQRSATPDTVAAARELAVRLVSFVEALPPYAEADGIVAMPPSDPNKAFDLPSHLGNLMSRRLQIPDLSRHVRTVGARPSVKSTPLAKKLEMIEGTIAVDENVFDSSRVLLVDDLYQSGVSMNYVAQLLLEKGASAVYGLACEKTCRNDDNFRGG